MGHDKEAPAPSWNPVPGEYPMMGIMMARTFREGIWVLIFF